MREDSCDADCSLSSRGAGRAESRDLARTIEEGGFVRREYEYELGKAAKGDEEDTGAPNVTKLDSSLPREASFKRENVLSYARRGFFFIGKGLKPFSVCGMSLSSIAMSRGN